MVWQEFVLWTLEEDREEERKKESAQGRDYNLKL
jgi:hypothetical protein